MLGHPFAHLRSLQKPHDHSDLYAERSTFGCGTTLLLRNARPDAVQRLLEKTRQLEALPQRVHRAVRRAPCHGFS